MAPWTLPAELASWIEKLAGLLHRRLAWRLVPLFVGALFGQGRKTVASWLRGGQLGDDFKAYYYFLGSLVQKKGTFMFSIDAIEFRGIIGSCHALQELPLAAFVITSSIAGTTAAKSS